MRLRYILSDNNRVPKDSHGKEKDIHSIKSIVFSGTTIVIHYDEWNEEVKRIITHITTLQLAEIEMYQVYDQ